VAIRWHHYKLVEYLLVEISWPIDYLKHSLKNCTSEEQNIIKLIKKKMIEERKKTKSKSGCFACFR
jgi:hypothetical protein